MAHANARASRVEPPCRASSSTPLYLLHDTPQGLSRFASDIIIRGFDTPCKLGFYDGNLLAENLD